MNKYHIYENITTIIAMAIIIPTVAYFTKSIFCFLGLFLLLNMNHTPKK